jgi:2-polyprenyl-6-methoxyphenol hydroxylase-like FAD-dependent oxidoreductase
MIDVEHSQAVDALVIGAGPSGLLSAIELTRHGVPVRIVDAAHTPHRQSRATTVMPSSLCLLSRAGVVQPFLDAANRIDRFTLRDGALNELSSLDLSDLDHPMPFALTLPQWMTEQFLTERLSELGVEVERGVTVAELDPRVDGTGALLEGPGGRSTIDARAVVGAGGSHGALRSTIRQVLEGTTYGRQFSVSDVVLDRKLPRDEITRIVSDHGVALFSPLLDDRSLVVLDLSSEPDSATREAPTLEMVQQLLDERCQPSVGVSDLRWSSTFRLHRRIAKSFGDLRRYLIGDAAHLESLFSGMGMNAGLHDAGNLCWKLAYWLQRRAHAGLMHTYVLERRPADERSIATSDAGYHRLFAAQRDPHALADGAVATAPAPGGDPASDPRLAVLMLDERYAGSPLVGAWVNADTKPALTLIPGTLFPEPQLTGGLLHTLYLGSGAAVPTPFAERWRHIVEPMGDAPACVPDGAMVLVRPDGFIGFVGAPASQPAFAQLDGMLASWFRLPEPFREPGAED